MRELGAARSAVLVATELVTRAERRQGEMTAAMETAPAGNERVQPSSGVRIQAIKTEALADHGLAQIGPALRWVFERAAAAGQGGDRVFPGRGGRPMSSSTIADVFAAIVVDAELPADATVGGLRAAVATSLAASAGLKVAAAMLGHADERTTLRYVRPSVDDRTNAAIAWTSAIAAAALKKTPSDP